MRVHNKAAGGFLAERLHIDAYIQLSLVMLTPSRLSVNNEPLGSC
jgi:hypothetical protein